MRRFLIKWVGFFSILIIMVAGYQYFVSNKVSGDIGRLGRIPFTLEYNAKIGCYNYINNPKSILVDVDSVSGYPLLLIGDSFSEPENALGHTLSDVMGDTVHVICDVTVDGIYEPVKVLWYGLNNGSFRPGQTVVLESIGRFLSLRFAEIDFSDTQRHKKLYAAYNWRASQSSRFRSMKKEYENMGGANPPFQLNEMLTWIRTKLGYKATVRHTPLTGTFFDHEVYGDELYYLKDDYKVCNLSEAQLRAIAEGVERVFAKAREKGVNLYLFLTPDKYDLYYPYMKNAPKTNPNVRDFQQYLSPEVKGRIFSTVDSLRPYLDRGELDIYRANDTHWSVYAAEEMGKKLATRLLNDSVLISQ